MTSRPPSTLGRCRLCEQSKKLCDSHIIPKFCYKPLRDANGKAIEVNIDQEEVLDRQFAGHREKLLCVDCENRFSRFETHSVRLFCSPLPPFSTGSKRIREYSDLDYRTLKLFFLSVLWRSSVAINPFFKHVSLGPHEEIIRDMLLREDPGGTGDYPTLIWLLTLRGKHLQDILVEPTPMRVGTHKCKCYRFVMAGFVIIIGVSSSPLEDSLLRWAMSPGEPVQSYDSEFGEFAFLRAVHEGVANMPDGKTASSP